MVPLERLLPTLLAAALAVAGALAPPAGDAESGAAGEGELPPVDFGREVRPLLAGRCLVCHGPDEAVREADLRLDRRAGLFADRGGYAAVVPGDSAASEIWLRVSDEYDPMPPRSSELELTDDERALLRRWIDEGAQWEEHWAFVPPERPEPPRPAPGGAHEGWPRNEVDAFVLARMEAAGLAPAPQASKEALLRRVTLDLTGLPPTLEELDAFLADERPDAYEQVVDRLLDSTAHAEELTRQWLDAARYGDTHGYHLDNERSLWRWRDWVIDAFASDMPFDRFTVEQLAGDLLPDPTLEQRIATGFHRCNPTTGEGGAIEEEFLVRYAVDRVATTSTVWLGLTMACAQCHDHKFDPVSQREFYGLMAFFRNVAERGLDQNALAPPPALPAPTPAQRAELERFAEEVAALRAELDAPDEALDAAQREWEAEQRGRLAGRWQALEPLSMLSTGGSSFRRLEDGSLLVEGVNPTTDDYELVARTDLVGISALRLDALTFEGAKEGRIGRADNGNVVLSAVELEVAPAERPDESVRVPLTLALADHEQDGYPIRAAIDGDPQTGWAVLPSTGDRVALFLPEEPFGFEGGTLVRVALRHASRFPRHTLGRFRLSLATDESLRPARLGPWHSVGPFPAADGPTAHATAFGPEASLEGPYEAEGAPLAWSEHPEWADGAVVELPPTENAATYLHRTIASDDTRVLELSLGSDDALKIWLNGALVHDELVARPAAPDQARVSLALRPGANELLLKVSNYAGVHGFYFARASEQVGGLPLDLALALERDGDARDEATDTELRRRFRVAESEAYRALDAQLEATRADESALRAEVPTTMVMAERMEPRATHVLERGSYDRPGEEVAPGVPAILPPLPADAPRDRLGLARWIVSEDNPLTARVTANRVWQRLFGRGLVETAEDFGTRGALPTHPRLLDWLATELVASGWDLDRLYRLVVTSATYRQDSCVPAAAAERDPRNLLLSHAPRPRLHAEAIRDQALAAAGLLDRAVGGPSVKPYQPGGLWKAVGYPTSNTAEFEQDHGAALYRRSMYTFWKRTSPPPTMALFDAPNREELCVRRSRTNTPLQALALMNDVQFVEAARFLAERALREAAGGSDEPDDAAVATRAFRLVLSRRPEAEELDVLLRLLDEQRAVYAADPAAAEALLAVGEGARDPALPPAEQAAWTVVANLILNLDEAVTRG